MSAVRSSAQAIKEARYAELLDERSVTEQLLQRAFDEKRYWLGKSAIEVDYWQGRIQSLQLSLKITNGCIRVVLAPDEKDRYAGERETARAEDAETVGASNGSTDWSNA